MGDRVGDLVGEYVEALASRGRSAGGPKPVTFSLRLGEADHAKLVRLAEGLGAQKTPLAERLLKAALDEAIERYARWAAPDDPEGLVEEMGRPAAGPPGAGRAGGRTPHLLDEALGIVGGGPPRVALDGLVQRRLQEPLGQRRLLGAEALGQAHQLGVIRLAEPQGERHRLRPARRSSPAGQRLHVLAHQVPNPVAHPFLLAPCLYSIPPGAAASRRPVVL